jgi:hypothetical protein
LTKNDVSTPRSVRTNAGKGVYVHHFRMRGVRGPDIHPKHFPVRILCRVSHNQMGNGESEAHVARNPTGRHTLFLTIGRS